MPLTRAIGLPALLLAPLFCTLTLADEPKPAPVENVSSLPHRTPEEERRALHVPPGFEIQLVAAEPEIQKPLNIAFDDRGRLWVTDTVEYPYPAKDGIKPRDTVKILSNFGPDGRARTIQTFADGLNIPIGLIPLPAADAALVHSIPSIYLLRDSDGDGKADSREVFYTAIGSRDTHGMTNAFTWGFDGWIYACHGYANDSSVKGKDGKPIRMNSGNTYRFRPNGTHAEYFTHGQVNPFGLAFDPLGNLYSCDCHSRPVYQLLRGAWYPSFGKPHDGLGFGPEMVTHDHGSTGIAGISYYAADRFPEPYRGTVFIGNVVTNRINHDRIEWHGSTPRGIEQPDFVWSEDNWFRPVDIELGPDGALYVADFYNRIIGHYEVPLTHPGRDRTSGRVWRIVYRGNEGKVPPPPGADDRTASDLDALMADLDNPNLAVRISAVNQIVGRMGERAVEPLRQSLAPDASSRRRVHALWALQRLGKLDDQALLTCAREPMDRDLRVHGLKVMAERSELAPTLRELAQAELKDPDPFVKRAAAETLGIHADASNLRPLLALRQSVSPDDSHLLHVVRIALRDQLQSDVAWAALEKMELSERDRQDLADVATGVHGARAAAFLLDRLRSGVPKGEDPSRFVHHVARYGAEGSVEKLLEYVRAQGRPDADRLALLRMIQQGSQERGAAVDPRVRSLASELCHGLLSSGKDPQVALALEAARDFRLRELLPGMEKLVREGDLPGSRRGDVLQAVAAIDPEEGLKFLRGLLGTATTPIELRESAGIALANLDLPGAQAAVLETLPTAPERLQSTMAAALARRPAGASALLQSIEAGKASARLLQERRIVIGLENASIPDLSRRVESLLKGLPPADQKLKELLDRRKAQFASSQHDDASGGRVFEKNCAICHQLEGKGARIGPQLDGIGSRGLERLLEDVLDPNRNVDQSFRVTNLALENGRIVSGLLLREEGEVLVVADAQGKEIRVPRSEVEERTTAQISPMPANMAEQISESEFADLMSYLLRHREDKSPR
jgi:putative heme-binding domain-containing protein